MERASSSTLVSTGKESSHIRIMLPPAARRGAERATSQRGRALCLSEGKSHDGGVFSQGACVHSTPSRCVTGRGVQSEHQGKT